MFKNKKLLITGGTGSFGNAVLARFLNSDLDEIRIFSRDEKKQDDMRIKYKNEKLKFYLGDVRDIASLQAAMSNVDFVFHAAALKQVPSCEFFPLEAVKTNVLGTENVLTAALQAGVSKVICLSTDKAAYPVNAMGISKAMMEKTFIAKSRMIDDKQMIICGTRYGNVMASRGSVIPLFVEQIKSGKDMTITDPKMTRFIMSLEEAVELVLYAFKHANNGDIFVQKSPASYIQDLAQALKELFQTNNGIQTIGSRHGEKIYEVLLTKEEASKAIEIDNYFRVPADNRDLNYSRYLDHGSPSTLLSQEYNSNNTTILNVEQIREKLLQLPYIQYELAAWRSRA